MRRFLLSLFLNQGLSKDELRAATKAERDENARKESIIKQVVSLQGPEYYGNPRTKGFHDQECRYYNETTCNLRFSSRNKAMAAGYDPCGHCRPGAILSEGRYRLTVEFADIVDSRDSGHLGIDIVLSTKKHPGSQPVAHYISFALENNPKDKNQTSLRMAKAFFDAFNIQFKPDRFNPTDFSADDLIGATGNVKVKVIDIDGELANQLVLREP